MREETFSQRHGMVPGDTTITMRHEAPQWLRDFIISQANSAGVGREELREILCTRLLESPDVNNWSHGNIDAEVRSLLQKAEWFEVYDFLEDVAAWLDHHGGRNELDQLCRNVNDAFKRKGIGWLLVNGILETRGEESFEASVRPAIALATDMVKPVAAKELHEALHDLSKRPEPDISGAIQHGMAALECVAREVTGDLNVTLGELLKRHPGTLPPPLDKALSQIWGFASERGRHLKESAPPSFEEAELIVGLSGTLATYLLKKFKSEEASKF